MRLDRVTILRPLENESYLFWCHGYSGTVVLNVQYWLKLCQPSFICLVLVVVHFFVYL